MRPLRHRPGARLAVVIALASVAILARAAEVMTTDATSATTHFAVTVRAERMDRPADAIEQQIRVPATNSFALPQGLWEIRLRSDSFWARPVYLRDSDSVSMPVFPAVAFRGSAKGHSTLRLSFTSLDANGATGDCECKVGGDSWVCTIPPGRYDLRFSTPGSAPEHRFDVKIPNKEEVALKFVAGASLTGRLQSVRDAKTSLEGLEVSLAPMGPNGPQRQTTRSTVKGFFQFKGLAPGAYVVRARGAGLVTRAVSVTVIAGLAAEMTAPLLLDRPKRLTVLLAPPLDPDLKPWIVSLASLDAARSHASVVSESSATASGEWSASGLIAGDYVLSVRRPNGQQWAFQETTIVDDTTLPLTITGERISGEITFGERPLRAKLSFGGEGGVTLQSDAAGRFEGEIPLQDGDERAVFVDGDPLPIEITIRTKIDRTESGERRILIHLPETSLSGRVLLSDGSPGSHVIVTATRRNPRVLTQTISGENGTFAFMGIAAGDWHVLADDERYGRSESQVRVASGEAAEVDLVLRSHVVVHGSFATGANPVIQADVYAFPRDTSFAPFLPQAKTTNGGRFEIKLPPKTTIADLFLVHPAFDIAMTRISMPPDVVHNITATQIGGTLIVDAKSPERLLLRHSGAECWLSWLPILPGVGAAIDSSRVVVSRLQPGEYSVCDAQTNQCGRGYVPPFGTLTLTLN